MSPELLDCVEIEPDGVARSAVIWLHGLGADGHDFEPIVPELGVDPSHAIRFVFPHAPQRPVTINGGFVMPAWYDIRALSLSRDVDERGVLDSAERVHALIRHENARGIPAERIVLAGFSQGAAMALHVGLRYPEALAGIVALSTYLVRDESLEEERSEANLGIRIFQAHGTMDPMVRPEAGQLAFDRLKALGYSIEFRAYPMAHEVHPDEIAAVGEALDLMFSA
ncbi:MAG: alpha/beta fold hydrolase [Acidobacteria bacterium]|nr:alpha/beta fold hydrolase [Acidobacteriota bacterium]NIM60355.1 alpha/beta fold hydrolase [Acidobacteriota bacterium]NIO58563.1 alpha/beta fold hydrolase [Acidobacteriota bacterium]NIQ29614.1 alpha/beta fold hydrolase [Acidobacteriota bacterium]NIQ84322.1 alpha/beta fold hydrolase [Acidobacteriota bacterium]